MIVPFTQYYILLMPSFVRRVVRCIKHWLICHIVRRDKFVDEASSAMRKRISNILYEEEVHLFNGTNLKESNRLYTNRVIEFNHVSCYGMSDIIRLDKNHYYYEVRNYYRKQKNDGISSKDYSTLLLDEKYYYLLKRYSQHQHVAEGILLSSYFANNYYHFTFQCIAKLRSCKHVPKHVPLLVHESIKKYASFQKLIEICNVDKRDLIYMDEETQYDVDKLYYISPQMMSVPCYREGSVKTIDDDWYSKESISYLREMILPHIDKEWDVPNYIFLERRFASGRRSYNEEECKELLQQYGFEAIRPETLSLERQVALFNKAHCIVGATGGAYTNLVYGNENGTFVILKGARSTSSVWSAIVGFIGASLMYVLDASKGELTDASQEHDSFHIDVDELRGVVEGIIHKDKYDSI